MTGRDPLDVGIVAYQVRRGRSGSHEPYVDGLLQGLGELQAGARLTVYLQDEQPRVPESFLALPRASVVTRWLPLPHRAARLANEAITGAMASHDVLFFTGSSIAPYSRAPMVSIVHADARLQPGSYGRAQTAVSGAMLLRMRRGAAAVIAPTAAYAQHLEAAWGLPAERTFAIAHGVDDFAAAAASEDFGGGVHLVAVTNSKAHKNIPTLLRGWIDARRSTPDAHLWLIGNVEGADAIERVLALDATALPFLHLEPWLAHAEVMRRIAGAHALLFVSERETFGMPLAEAMAAGTPVIAADTAVAREVCDDAALYVPPRDAAALAAAIRRLVDEPQHADELRRRGRDRASMFTWRECARRTLEVLERVARAAPPKR